MLLVQLVLLDLLVVLQAQRELQAQQAHLERQDHKGFADLLVPQG